MIVYILKRYAKIIRKEDNMSESVISEAKNCGFEHFSTLIGATMKSLDRLKSKGMEAYGLSGTHTLCMRLLYDNPEGLTRIQLSNALSVDRAQVTRIVLEMISEGLLEEEQSGRHGYRKKCKLTAKGREVTASINETVERINRFVSGDIPKDELESFYKTFELICDNLKKAEEML